MATVRSFPQPPALTMSKVPPASSPISEKIVRGNLRTTIEYIDSNKTDLDLGTMYSNSNILSIKEYEKNTQSSKNLVCPTVTTTLVNNIFVNSTSIANYVNKITSGNK